MFTGIIKSKGLIKNARTREGSLFLEVSFPRKWRLRKGESIAIDGICTTIRQIKKAIFEVECMPETIGKTTVKYWRKGKLVNLERSLAVGDRMGGGFVQGHIDEAGRIISIRRKGLSKILKIKISGDNSKYFVSKGGVTINGVNLTVAQKGHDWFSVSLVSYTLRHTNLEQLKRGDFVNIEIDILAKYAKEHDTKK